MNISTLYRSNKSQGVFPVVTWAVFLLLGIFLLSFNINAAIVFFVMVPLHYIMLVFSLKTKNILTSIFFVFYFVSFGIGAVLFFLRKEKFEIVGSTAVAQYDFSLAWFFRVYSYLFVFLLVLLALTKLFQKSFHSNIITGFLKDEVIRFFQRPKSTYSLLPLIVVLIVCFSISMWMFYHQIGMIGFIPPNLPYHLSGILFFVRYLVFPVLILFFYFKTKDKVPASYVVFIYSILNGLAATSKSVALYTIIPVIFVLFNLGYRRHGWLLTFLGLLGYYFIGNAREVVYMFGTDIGYSAMFDFGIEKINQIVFGKESLIVEILGNFTNRLYGPQSLILTEQFANTSINDFISYYFGFERIDALVPNITSDMYGVVFDEDRAYGVSFGYTGTFMLLSSKNYFLVILEALIISCFFIVQNNALQKIVLFDMSKMKKYVAVGTTALAMIDFYSGHDMLLMYVNILLLLIMANTGRKRRRLQNKHY